ncbi:uncharacterized protein LOC105695371 [Orussus abietinus]|uniref:uncharacterized protein LOC105695371 n=1 Tax=Orussus abietinus TaxID=222816 RepID=UPI000626904A|nr:uncharacterized protein LOC105695371 [Orussus abietinus]XP_012272305.1 uncharacterized protein LOC105695371 [Orussus abietinus]
MPGIHVRTVGQFDWLKKENEPALTIPGSYWLCHKSSIYKFTFKYQRSTKNDEQFTYGRELMLIIRRIIKCQPRQGQQFGTRHLLVTYNNTLWTRQDKMFAMVKFKTRPEAVTFPRAFVLTIKIADPSETTTSSLDGTGSSNNGSFRNTDFQKTVSQEWNGKLTPEDAIEFNSETYTSSNNYKTSYVYKANTDILSSSTESDHIEKASFISSNNNGTVSWLGSPTVRSTTMDNINGHSDDLEELEMNANSNVDGIEETSTRKNFISVLNKISNGSLCEEKVDKIQSNDNYISKKISVQREDKEDPFNTFNSPSNSAKQHKKSNDFRRNAEESDKEKFRPSKKIKTTRFNDLEELPLLERYLLEQVTDDRNRIAVTDDRSDGNADKVESPTMDSANLPYQYIIEKEIENSESNMCPSIKNTLSPICHSNETFESPSLATPINANNLESSSNNDQCLEYLKEGTSYPDNDKEAIEMARNEKENNCTVPLAVTERSINDTASPIPRSTRPSPFKRSRSRSSKIGNYRNKEEKTGTEQNGDTNGTLRSSDITDLVMEGLMFTIRQGRDSVTVVEQRTKLEMDEVLENSEKAETKEGEKCLLNSSLLRLENLITRIDMPGGTDNTRHKTVSSPLEEILKLTPSNNENFAMNKARNFLESTETPKVVPMQDPLTPNPSVSQNIGNGLDNPRSKILTKRRRRQMQLPERPLRSSVRNLRRSSEVNSSEKKFCVSQPSKKVTASAEVSNTPEKSANLSSKRKSTKIAKRKQASGETNESKNVREQTIQECDGDQLADNKMPMDTSETLMETEKDNEEGTDFDHEEDEDIIPEFLQHEPSHSGGPIDLLMDDIDPKEEELDYVTALQEDGINVSQKPMLPETCNKENSLLSQDNNSTGNENEQSLNADQTLLEKKNNSVRKRLSETPRVVSNKLITDDQIPLALQRVLKNKIIKRRTVSVSSDGSSMLPVECESAGNISPNTPKPMLDEMRNDECESSPSQNISDDTKSKSTYPNAQSEDHVDIKESTVTPAERLNESEKNTSNKDSSTTSTLISTEDSLRKLSERRDITEEFYRELNEDIQQRKHGDPAKKKLRLRKRTSDTSGRSIKSEELTVEMWKLVHDITRGARVVVTRMDVIKTPKVS